MYVHDIQSIEQLQYLFDNAVNQLIIMDMYGTWCPPCKALSPVFERLAQKHTGALFIKVDVDLFDSVATQFKVTSMPTIVFVKNFVEIDRVVGANIQKIEELINKHV
jgi:thioredoxin 1